MANILLTGAGGQVGWELRRSLSLLGKVIAPGRPELDLANSDSIRATVELSRPALIVNAAAYTAVDRAESEPEQALRINGVAPGILAEEAERAGAALVHYSTDYVFDGSNSVPYLETDQPNPLNSYGRSKLAGDRAVAEAGGAYLIMRTSWVYAARGRNFLLTMLKLAKSRHELAVVDDQVGSPTSSRVIADATAQILGRLFSLGGKPRLVEGIREHRGLYNLTCDGQVSWCGFARKIFELSPQLPKPVVRAIGSSEYPTAARRPRYSVLSSRKLEETFRLKLPPWQEALERVMEELFAISTGQGDSELRSV